MPAIVADTHEDAAERFLEFFAATIRNANTRAAYMTAVADFLAFAPVAGLGSLAEIRSIHVSAYVEHVAARFAPQTVKQRLAALRGLFDWLARHGVLDHNPAAPVRGPAYSTKRGKTPILTAAEAKRLIESIETDSLVGLRDRALIGVMVYSFARISAAVGMDVEDLVQTAGRSWLRLHEKGGKVHEMPVHHRLLEHLDVYLAALGPQDAKTPLFRSARGRTGALTAERLTRFDAYAMVRRRAAKAGVVEKIGNHSFRGTGITTFLLNDGSLELAQEMANHASPRTTKLYDRRDDKITQDAVERIRIE
ncbi:tyrosine-type recombinase/integrase [Phenylobacterium sp. LjRoot219]|uniref:tyrosine-type recombinase/integrase n=1 Tax=Phenylobacterium sp. LjRoot219 TaxID=3342283 RepID=UPI003ECD3FAA